VCVEDDLEFNKDTSEKKLFFVNAPSFSQDDGD